MQVWPGWWRREGTSKGLDRMCCCRLCESIWAFWRESGVSAQRVGDLKGGYVGDAGLQARCSWFCTVRAGAGRIDERFKREGGRPTWVLQVAARLGRESTARSRFLNNNQIAHYKLISTRALLQLQIY